MAVTGPFTRTEQTGTGYHVQRTKRVWYRQTAPHRAPLPYVVNHWGELPGNESTDPTSWSYSHWDSRANSEMIRKARERFIASTGTRASLGITLGELGQSLDMIAHRGIQLARGFRALRRGDVRGVARAFSLKDVRRIPKKFANAVLEYNYGWTPLVQDIGSAVDVLQKPIPNARAFGSSSNYVELNRIEEYDPKTGYVRDLFVYEKMGCHMRAEIKVSNPNLYLANQLGLINPAVVAWDLVPFSFVVDWFIPVGSFLNQWTDTVGLTLIHPSTTRKSTIYSRDQADRVKPYLRYRRFKYKFEFIRQPGIASFQLVPNRVTGFSAHRALNAISMCIQQLRA